MKCQKCKKKDATIRVVEISSDGQREKFLCNICARKNPKLMKELGNPQSLLEVAKKVVGVENNQAFLRKMLEEPESLAPMRNIFGIDLQKVTPDYDKLCPRCGIDLPTIIHTNKQGCDLCYATFAHFITSMHADKMRHCGKIPKRAGQKVTVQDGLTYWREKLAEYVKIEDYHAAAKARDQIKALEEKHE